MGVPKHMDLPEILSDYLLVKGLVRILNIDGSYYDKDNNIVDPEPLKGGVSHIAAKSSKKEIIQSSLEAMLQLADALDANACEIVDNPVEYTRRIDQFPYTDSANTIYIYNVQLFKI